MMDHHEVSYNIYLCSHGIYYICTNEFEYPNICLLHVQCGIFTNHVCTTYSTYNQFLHGLNDFHLLMTDMKNQCQKFETDV